MPISSDGVLTATPDAATASVLVKFDFTGLGVPLPTTNLVRNPNSEAVAALVAVANVTTARVTTPFRTGAASTRMTATAAASMVASSLVGLSLAAVIAGDYYTGSVYVRAAATARTCQVGIRWYDAAGALISMSAVGSAVDTTTGWTRVAAVGVQAPSNARYGSVAVTVVSAALSEIHYVDDIQLEHGSTLTAYCDGNQLGAGWNGAVNNSISVRPPFDRVTVYRSAPGAAQVVVRGIDNAQHPGGVGAGIDHEAPLGVLCTYTAVLSTRNGPVLASTGAATTIARGAYTAYLKSLSTPSLSVAINVHHYPDWSNVVDVGVLRIIGAEYPITIEGQQQSGDGTLEVNTRDAAARAALRALLRAGGPYLLQPSAESGEEDRYVTAGTRNWTRPYEVSSQQRRITQLPLTTISRPPTSGSAVAYPGHTYADSKVRWPLFSNRSGTFLDRLVT